MKTKMLYALIVAAGCWGCKSSDPQMVLDIDLNSRGAEIPESLYGVFFEEINHAGDGGLYGEMLMNRSFEDRVVPEGYWVDSAELVTPIVRSHLSGDSVSGRYKWGIDPYPGWELVVAPDARAEMSLTTESPNFDSAPHSMRVNVAKTGGGVSLCNTGFWGISLQKGESYRLRMFMRSRVEAGEMCVRLLGADDKELGRVVLSLENDDCWQEYKAVFQASDTTTVGRLSIDLPDSGVYGFDYVSLFPEKTYKGRENGMRQDVAGMIEDLHPAFIRWPGGCIVEGITLNNRVQWKHTLGDPAARPGEYDTWGYRNSYGIGYKEFLDFCEDVGAKGMYVCNVGLACQYRTGEACPDHEAEAYLQDALDAIEYALGDTTTAWGAVRAKEGHPEPYPLAYVEIGNENWGPLYNRRFDMFYKRIKAKYPQLTLISTHGMGGLDTAEKTDMIDPHWYVSANFFFNNADIFDNFKRGDYKIYVGEYACNREVGGGNLLAALSEAAFMTGMERNSDLVTMASYAPLFENKNDRGWPTNLIWIDNDQVVGRSSYYVQKMFARHRPTYNLSIHAPVLPQAPGKMDFEGYMGLGTWDTRIQVRNLAVTDRSGEMIKADMTDSSQWVVADGEWVEHGGLFEQKSRGARTALLWKGVKPGVGDVIEFEFNRLSGDGGFLAYLGMKSLDMKQGYMLNACGWTVVESICNGENKAVSDFTGDCFKTGHWYKVKIELNENSMVYSIDGRQVLVYSDNPVRQHFFVAGYDERADEVVIKVVNASDNRCETQINLNGGEVESSGKVVTLCGSSLEEENSFDDPLKISPVETRFNHFSSSFRYELQPRSLTILRIKRK